MHLHDLQSHGVHHHGHYPAATVAAGRGRQHFFSSFPSIRASEAIPIPSFNLSQFSPQRHVLHQSKKIFDNYLITALGSAEYTI
jgi:hypothetical protein